VEVDLSNSDAAAVLVILTEFDTGDHVLLTQRASQLKVHAGEVAFPGGRWEPGDVCLKHTALRETYEEVGLAADHIEIIGQLPAGHTRHQAKVIPYVGRVPNNVILTVNKAELDSYFWVPISFFIDDSRERTDSFHYRGREFWAPAYTFGGYLIWGFTARIIVALLDQFYGVIIAK